MALTRQYPGQHISSLQQDAPLCLILRSAFACAGARETVRFLPPLNVSELEVKEALRTFEEALEEVFGLVERQGGERT